ncbi:MAG: alpha-glucan family phosphorylase [Bacteroidales bacterium]|nr:alpha-glucan family phosphorylase [Bacteroidales bacterium]
MNEKMHLKADYLFEVSWEVCNKIGGIYTVIASKSSFFKDRLQDNYIMIGPDVWKETSGNPYFNEDRYLMKAWREYAESSGLKIRIGRFPQASDTLAILVDFTPYFSSKDQIFAHFWEKHHVDSIAGQWDYTEPALFGYAAAKVIENFCEFYITPLDQVVAQFHEWLSGSGVLYLNENLPQAGTVFTSHATVLGRSIAGNGLHLYENLSAFKGEQMASELNVRAKYSLEKQVARAADALTTVSEVTRREAIQFFERDIDFLTPNGIHVVATPDSTEYVEKREHGKKLLRSVAEAVYGISLPENALHVGMSGRYEYKNKGIDYYLSLVEQLANRKDQKRPIVAWLFIPAHQSGAREEIQKRISQPKRGFSGSILTHNLYDAGRDQILNFASAKFPAPGSNVYLIFVPSFLDGSDGIFNVRYYDLLMALDLTVFPSYYEPWGYTPHESLSFGVPTTTTSLAGFGKWLIDTAQNQSDAALVIDREVQLTEKPIQSIVDWIDRIALLSAEDYSLLQTKCVKIAANANWNVMGVKYVETYNFVLDEVAKRSDQIATRKILHSELPFTRKKSVPSWKKLFIHPSIPSSLQDIQRISKNLWWTWNQEALDLFESLDVNLWKEVKYNPITLIEELSFERWQQLENDAEFCMKLKKVVQKFNTYMSEKRNPDEKLIAYFSMEYGLHDTVKIFSGGLGMLAGDYLKEASDTNHNFVSIGLLYRYGYFQQEISIVGDQVAAYLPQKFSHMPLHPVRDEKGDWITISIALPGRNMIAKAWRLDVGRVPLYLLDTDIPENAEQDRSVTHQLYGGNWENRFKQELLLGVGGIRLLEKLKITPSLYHLNEGHAAFIGLERLKDLVQGERLTFDQAVEVVRSTSLFTTHTPVPAGHDSFSEDLMRAYIPHYASRLNISWEEFMSLGRFDEGDLSSNFSMSALASKLSQEINGVSRIHGRVTREMFNEMYEGYFPDELHIGYVTNGVHYSTWTARSLQRLYTKYFGTDFLNDVSDPKHWEKIKNVPDAELWEERQKQKKQLMSFLHNRLSDDMTRREENPKLIVRTLDSLNNEMLTIGFARRFATYKRAHLLFSNPERLARILHNSERPVRFVYAGKAHPNDKAGQELIKKIIEISKKPEFVGKIIFVENYDIELAKYLIHGVDVWMNTPTRPLEASGTSGQKAVMNGVVNLSVLDGWWAEGYRPGAGWALKEERTFLNQSAQDELDAETIYSLLEDEIIPAYFNRNAQGMPNEWLSHIRNTLAWIAPQFTTRRMIDDYYNQFYNRLFKRAELIAQNQYQPAEVLSKWKRRISRKWDKIEAIQIQINDDKDKAFNMGDLFKAEVLIHGAGLTEGDLGLEVLFGRKENDQVNKVLFKQEMLGQSTDNQIIKFTCELPIVNAGVFDYAFRLFPKHPMLAHRMDLPLVKWF